MELLAPRGVISTTKTLVLYGTRHKLMSKKRTGRLGFEPTPRPNCLPVPLGTDPATNFYAENEKPKISKKYLRVC